MKTIYTITNNIFNISTDIEIEIIKQNTILIKEKIQEKPALFVMPHFEEIANDILNMHFTNKDASSIKWFHFTPYHNIEKPDSIHNYREITTTVKNNKIVGAEWNTLFN
jgi:hypothetical protein